MLPNKKYTPSTMLEILKTRGLFLAIPAAIGLLMALVVSSTLPNMYEAETLIQIVPQRVPDSYVRSIVTMKTEDRLEALGAQVKSRTQLEKIITELDLYKKERAVQPMQDVVEKMRAGIADIEVVRPNRVAPVDAFYLRFKYEDPVMAARVTERLGMLYIDYNARERETLAHGTNQFLLDQLEEARKRLEAADRRLREFSERNAGKLPSQLQSNMQAITTKSTERQALIESLARDRDRLLYLERLYNDKLATPAPTAPVAADPSNNPTATASGSARQQLERAKASLTAAQAKYAEGHPDLRRARRQVEELEKQVAALPSEGPSGGPAGMSAEDVQRQDQINTLRADIESLGRQIKFKEAQEAGMSKTIGDYQSRIEAVPGVESEYLKLSRDHETIQESFKDLLGKSEAARVAENLESRQVGEQFRVLDPPRVPGRPISPLRAQISGGGFLGGLVFGFLIVGLLEIRDGSFKTSVDIAEVLSLPVVAVVPAFQSADEQRRSKRRWLLLSGVAGAMTVAAGYTVWAMRLWHFVA